MERSTSMSHETVRRITENDPTLTTLVIARENMNAREELGTLVDEGYGLFDPNNRSELGKLGESIAKNNALEALSIHGDELPDTTITTTRSHRIFFDGIKHNASVDTLRLIRIDLSRGLGNEFLTSFKDRCHPLRKFIVVDCNLGGGGVAGSFNMASTLSAFKHVKKLHLTACNVDDQCLQTMLAAISGYKFQLKELNLRNNNIGRAGCGTLATLLKDPNSNLRHINLDRNRINDSCCTALADALKKNKKLQTLHLNQNPQITETGMYAFTEVLCDTTSINATCLSNHMLKKITCHEGTMSKHLTLLLDINSRTDKRLIAMQKVFSAMQKVLKYHRNLNMAPAFAWDLKLLPHLVDWFDEFRNRWKYNCPDDFEEELGGATAKLNKRKLSVMYQFVRAMPLMCVPNRIHRGVKRKHSHAV